MNNNYYTTSQLIDLIYDYHDLEDMGMKVIQIYQDSFTQYLIIEFAGEQWRRDDFRWREHCITSNKEIPEPYTNGPRWKKVKGKRVYDLTKEEALMLERQSKLSKIIKTNQNKDE